MNIKGFLGAFLLAGVVVSTAEATVTPFFSSASNCSSPITSTTFIPGTPGPATTVSLCVSTTTESVCGATVQLQAASAAEDGRFKVISRTLGAPLSDANAASIAFPVSVTNPKQVTDFGATVTSGTPPSPGTNQLLATFALQPQSTATNGSYTLSLSSLSSIASENSNCFGNPVDIPIAATLTLTQAGGGGGSNVALASAGAVASASSSYNSAYPVTAVNDNNRTGPWGSGGGWNDATPNSFPDWVQINFNGAQTIDRVVVYTLQDNFASAVEPSDSMTFSQQGVTDFTIQGWNGSAWVLLGSVSGNNLVKRTVTFTPFSTDRMRVNVSGGLGGYSRIIEIEAWGVPAVPPTQNNVAAASAGAVATASSAYNFLYPVSAVINGDRTGAQWGNGGGWNDATANSYPDSVQIEFTGPKTIDHVIVYTLQDNFASAVEPTDVMTFTQQGVTGFTVDAWNGTGWVNLATVSGNNLVKRTVNFAPTATDRIRVNVTNSLGGYSRLVEIEAFGYDTPKTGTNVGLASAGGVATASSEYNFWYPATSINNGDRTGSVWGSYGGWNDATPNAYPDWVQIDFSGPQTIDRVIVYTLQDNFASPVEPSDTMTFSSNGITDFTVEGWNGSAWVVLATVTNNTLVKRTVVFPAYSTDRLRVNVTGARGGYSRLAEIEAWGFPTPPTGVNVALPANGGVASASTSYNFLYPPSAVNNNDRTGAPWGNQGGWNDATPNGYPDWVQIDFTFGSKTIDRVVVYTLQDNFASPIEPTDTMTFTQNGIVDFTVEAWNGSAWVVLATVTGNNRVKRTVTFSPINTTKIRVNVTSAFGGYSRIVEIEAWGT